MQPIAVVGVGDQPEPDSRVGVDGESVASLPELSFVHALPGFRDLRRFVLVNLEDRAESVPDSVSAADPRVESPLYELRSLEQPDVRFMVAVPAAFFSDYKIELDDQECEDLGLTDPTDALVLVLLTVGRDAASTTANLLAPIVVNARTRVAAQVILSGSDWPVRAPLD